MFERRVVPVIVGRSCRETVVVYSGSCSVHKIHDVEITHLVVLGSSGRESELTLIIALSGTLFIYLSYQTVFLPNLDGSRLIIFHCAPCSLQKTKSYYTHLSQN